jgi:membrane fusion protein (multidrug efflux system)
MKPTVWGRVAYGRLCVLGGALTMTFTADCGGKPKPTTPPPPVVSVAAAEPRDVPGYHEHAGVLQAYVSADVRARVEGFLLDQRYTEGSFVKAGQLLFVIDPKTFEAAKLQAEGNLVQAKAALEKADADVTRDRPLVEKQAVSKQDLDHAVAAKDAAVGQVKAAEGALRTASLNLGYARVVAPVDGIAGIAQVRIGNLVGQGQPTLLATVYEVDPIRLVFSLPERDYIDLAKLVADFERAQAEGGPLPPEANGVQLVLADGSIFPSQGRIAVVGGPVDPATGTLTVQALFPNPDRVLRPGQYGRLRTRADIKQAVVVPQRALAQVQGRDQVAIVGADDKIEMRPVKLGPQSGSFVVVESGLRPGERVVIDGVSKVRSGQPVIAKPADTSAMPMASAPVEVEKRVPAGPSGGQGVTAPQPSGSTVPAPSGSTPPPPR